MTGLRDRLIARIAAEGPMTLAEYMAACLMDPDHGYYATRDPFGRGGDFITAPEISQMFGELIGLFLAQVWIDQGRPGRFVLAEPGPGRGTLMADALRALRAVPGARDAAEVHFVETSPTLRRAQAERVPEARWHDSVADLPEAPLFLVANEFLDALPIRQFRREADGWSETVIGLREGGLTFGRGPAAAYGGLAHRLDDTRPGDIVETCPALPAIAGEVAGRIARHGGVALVIDYGDWRSRGDTFQAVRAHHAVDPLAEPGRADLTAHVDFEALALGLVQGGARSSRMTPQGVFLERLGIAARAERLASALAGQALTAHLAAHRRLTHPAEMGSLFKVLACTPEGAAPPPGLDC